MTTPLAALRALELESHRAEVRSDPDKLGRLLHPLFFELARSGQRYSRDAVLDEFNGRPPACDIWSQEFAAEVLAEGLVLLTYRSAHVSDNGLLERHAVRASLWQHTGQGWQMRFHQGTPTEPFEKRAT